MTISKIEKERISIKGIKILKEGNNTKNSNLINRTFDVDEYMEKESEKITKTNINNEILNRTMKKLELTYLKDKILSKVENKKYINKDIKDISSEENKKYKNMQIQDDETQRIKIKKEENIILPVLINNKEVDKNKEEDIKN